MSGAQNTGLGQGYDSWLAQEMAAGSEQAVMRLLVFGLILTTMVALVLIAWRLSEPQVVVMQQPGRPAAPQVEQYLVAAHVLPAGTLARATDIGVRQAPVGKLPAGAILDSAFARASIEGALIRNYTEAGAPILESNVLRPRDRGFLAAVLPKGTRAISMPVDQVSGVAGLVWPGDHVDVLLTQIAADNPTAGERVRPGHQVMTETLLANIRVIAVDMDIVQGASPTAGVTGHLAHTVTLQVTPHQAKLLAVAQNLGRLMLTIRASAQAPGPQAESRGPLYASDASPNMTNRTPQAAGGKNVELIEGDQRSLIHFP